MKSNFIWCDLSTFDIKTARDFYQKVFHWKYQETKNETINEAYHMAYLGNDAISAIFVMPEFLQKLNMPSFWMSYISVENIDGIVKDAKNHGAIIEIKPMSFDGNSKIALIRDPSGAGFTVYEGKDLKGKYESGHGRMVWNVLHVNDITLVKSFYEEVFGFIIQPNSESNFRYDIFNASNELIAHADVISDDIKGDKQYWVPIFEVDDIDIFSKDVKSMGGTIVFRDDLYEYAIFADTQGASFMVKNKNEYIQYY